MDGPRRLSRRRIVAVVAALAVGLHHAACSADEGAPTLEPLPPASPVEIDAAPRLQVGVVAGDTMQQFHRVTTPFVLPDGRLAVPVAGSNAIRVFGSDGSFVASLGGRGEGPGEFASLDAAWPRGDTIEAFDNRLGRIVRFFPDGTNAAVRLDPVPAAQSAVPGILPDGWLTMGVADAGVGRRDDMVVHRFGLDGAHAGEVLRVEGMARLSAPGFVGPDPLSPRALFAVHGGEVYVAETLTPAIKVLDPTGTHRREITWEPEIGVSAEAAFGVVVDSLVARARPDDAAAMRQRLEAFPVRDRVSAFWDFIVDDQGFIWVRPYDVGRHAVALGGVTFGGAGPGGEWLIFTPDGSALGAVNMPDELEPIQITSDAVVGIRRDALGVESVRVHTVHRR